MKEVRIIDANALKEDLKHYFTEGVLDGVSAKVTFNQILHDIDNAPTVERPKGTWFVNPHSMIMKCMECGHIENTKEVGVVNEDKHFCYWCGADMRGEKE